MSRATVPTVRMPESLRMVGLASYQNARPRGMADVEDTDGSSSLARRPPRSGRPSRWAGQYGPAKLLSETPTFSERRSHGQGSS